MQEDHFGRSLFLTVLTSEGYFRNYKKLLRFLEKAIFGRIVADSRALKRAKERPKPTSIDPPNVLNKLLSRNPTLTRRCDVNKFNLVKYFFL